METNEEIVAVPDPSSVKKPSGRGKRAVARIIPDVCTGCGICVPVCPSNCISIVESELNFTGIAEIKDGCCTGCNICAIDCPWTAIFMLNPDGSRKDPEEYERQLKRLRGYQ